MSVTPVDASRERVQVAIRFRDPNDNEDSASCIDFDLPHDLTVHTIPGSGLCSSVSSYNAMSASRRMTFDRVFPPTTTQEELFESIGVPTVRSVLKGLNGTILAYGQTGSGKSHSMIGPNGGAPEALVHGTREYEQQGLIPRMLTFMFDTLRAHSIYREFALHDTVLGSTATTTSSSSTTTTPRLTEEEMERGAVLGRWGVPCNGHRSASGTGRQSRTNVTGVANRSTSQRKNHPTGQHVNETPHENELKASQSTSSATVETDMPLGDVEGSPSSPLGFRANRKTATLSAEISYSICMSVFELYMEQIIDLLDTDPPSGHPYLSPAKEYRIRESPLNGKGIFVENLTELRCTSHTEALNAIRDALSFRKASTTNLNERSSRSHCFVVLDVTQVDHTRHDARIMSRLCLVDLAGSEKVSKTGAEGVRLKEAQTINLSLTLLGNVIHKLTDKRALFVPYRDSKLTRLLQESFGGNSRTTLLCTCSESVTNRDETLSTLAFASRAKLIENKPRVNQKLKGKDLEVAYLRMMAECSRLNDRVRFLERSKNDHSANTTPRSTYRSFTGLGAEDTGENSARDTRQSALGNQSSARAHSAVPPIQLPSELFRTPRHTPIGSIHDEFSDVTPRGECYNSDHERLIQSLHATIDQLRAENIEKDALLMELNSRMEYYGNRFQALHESVGSVEQQLRQDQTIAMHWDRKLEEISHHLLKHEESRKKQSVDRFYPCANSNTTIESDNAERYSLRPSTSEYEISAIPTDVQTTKASTTNSCEDEHLELLRPEPQAYSKQRTAHSKVTLYANAETLRI